MIEPKLVIRVYGRMGEGIVGSGSVLSTPFVLLWSEGKAKAKRRQGGGMVEVF